MPQLHIDDVEVIVDKTIRKLTPENVAELFINMNSDFQAQFFNRVAEITREWKNGGLPFQMQYVSDSTYLKPEGRAVMQIIGEYGEHR